jgi:hypothetical protein
MIFTTIEPAPGLSRVDRRRVARSGPSAVLVRTSYPGLLASAGFVGIEYTDITADYRTTQQAWIEATRRRAQAIGAAMGEQALERRLADRAAALAAVDDGQLRRSQYATIRPG